MFAFLTNLRKNPRSSSRNPGQIRFRGFRPHFSAADRTAFVRLFTLARGHARSSSILFNPPIFRGGTRKFQPISARDLFRFPSLDGCERGLVRDSVHVPGDRLGPRGFGGVWCEFRSEHALGEWRTTPHAAPDANAPEPHLPVRNECRSPYAGLAPSERSIERARRRNRVHTGRSSSSGKS